MKTGLGCQLNMDCKTWCGVDVRKKERILQHDLESGQLLYVSNGIQYDVPKINSETLYLKSCILGAKQILTSIGSYLRIFSDKLSRFCGCRISARFILCSFMDQ